MPEPPAPPSWVDTLPIPEVDSVADGYYLIQGVVRGASHSINNPIVYVESNTIYWVAMSSNHYAYRYYEDGDEFIANNAPGNGYADNIVAATLSYEFTKGGRLDVDDMTKEDIIGKFIKE